ncbi:ABC transporter permease [Gemmatimonadota bacterium]
MTGLSGIFERIYRLFLLAYPRDFRADCAREMLETLGAREAAVRREGRLVRFWIRELYAVVRGGMALRWKLHRHRRTPESALQPVRYRRGSLDPLLQDTRFGLRTLRRRWLFTSIAIGTLGLGIGASTAVFSLVDGVLLQDPPFDNPEELVTVWATFPHWRGREGLDANWERIYVSLRDYRRWREEQTHFQDVAVYSTTVATLTGRGTPERLRIGTGSASLFPLLGVRPALGRAFLPGEDGHTARRIALLSHDFWQERFGGDPGVLGQTLELDLESYTVVGVLPRDFRLRSFGLFSSPGDSGERSFWVPMGNSEEEVEEGNRVFETIARLKPGVTIDQARAETVSLILGDKDPARNGVWLHPRRAEERRGVSTPLLILLGSSLLLLVVGCGNVATLLLGEVATRRHEIATRMSVGAGRGRIVRQLLTEAVLVGVGGSAVGILLALAATQGLLGMAPPLPNLDRVGVNGPVLAFAVAAGVLTGILFGLAPLTDLRKRSMAGALRGDRRAGGKREGWLQRSIVSVELALTVVLVISGGLMARSLSALMAVDPGYRPESVATIRPQLNMLFYPDIREWAALYAEMKEAVEKIPGVRSAGGTTSLPLVGFPAASTLDIVGQVLADGEQRPTANHRRVLPGYFETMGIPLLSGRTLTEADRSDSAPVAVVSESLARIAWPNRSAVGGQIRPGNRILTVVGVVGDVRHESLGTQAHPTLYMAYAQEYRGAVTLVARADGDPEDLLPLMREAVWSVAPDVPITQFGTMDAQVRESSQSERFRALLLGLFAITAALLAGAGVFGVTARSAARRTREMGIRMALGASREGLIRTVALGAMRASAVGIAVGLVGALVLTRLLSGYLFGVDVRDPATFAGAALLLGSLSVIAAVLPARRATRIAPMDVLREDSPRRIFPSQHRGLRGKEKGCDPLEASRLLPPIVEVGEGENHLPTILPPLPEGDQAIGLRIGKGTDEHAVHQGEGDCRGADSEGQRNDRDQREARVLDQTPNGVTDVFDKGAHRGSSRFLYAVCISLAAGTQMLYRGAQEQVGACPDPDPETTEGTAGRGEALQEESGHVVAEFPP